MVPKLIKESIGDIFLTKLIHINIRKKIKLSSTSFIQYLLACINISPIFVS